MGKRIDAVKEHLTKYKWYYVSAGLVVGTAGITCLIVKGTGLQGGPDSELQGGSEGYGNSVVNNTTHPLLFNLFGKVSDSQNIRNEFDITQIIESHRQGPPSWVIRCVETGELYSSQRKAAAELGLSEHNLSRHLNGLLDHVNDLHFERICIAA